MTGILRLAGRGAFARAVVDDLRAALDELGRDRLLEGADPEPGARAVLVLADHGDPLLDEVPERWHAAGKPSLVVAHVHPDVRIGPLDVPGTSLCRMCFATRQRQHDLTHAPQPCWPGAELAIGVDGFPPYLTSLVAGLVVDRLAVLDDLDGTAGGEVTVVNTESMACRTHPVVAVNRCARCGDQKPVGLKTAGQPMFPDLARVPR
ncbi:TOMM precursor leader peptide-binding protein [Labedaea rhizosphaerae]|uniref:Bacteriocin biosynthesis cyclodehydratase domain-containing protein n=1 Tax=Labedaea rhizosphaerae TaxID=598644 RepID=A0A4R6S2M0_LABRH|nr:TOMM precursor leader peptide-binding protein [Labedaea rhizosphaerae]TDP92905.1 bacteriocin biosynthesis cyclodehydratase domain-containing protein [Labedaea rhizosphaerae]